MNLRKGLIDSALTFIAKRLVAHRVPYLVLKRILMKDQLRVLKRVLLEDASLQRTLEDVRIREKICLDGSERLWRDERFLLMLEFCQQWKILSRVIDTDRVDIP